jgi:hypothetical protein
MAVAASLGTTPPASLPVHAVFAGSPLSTLAPSVACPQWRRRISPAEGKALELLGHAIEYLADEFVLHSGRIPSLHAQDPQIQALQLLMAANRQVYYSCPLITPMRTRLINRLRGRITGEAVR